MTEYNIKISGSGTALELALSMDLLQKSIIDSVKKGYSLESDPYYEDETIVVEITQTSL
jgi:hypothetical protein